jgi:hypothetical protein
MDDQRIEELIRVAVDAPATPSHAPSRLKSRIYSALMLAEADQGPLRELGETEAAGHGLCVFEKLAEIALVGSTAQQFNYCRICHARIMGEQWEDPPLYWPCCPYAEFKNR